MEIRKDVPGFEGKYMISNHGNVKSLDRFVNHRYGKRFSKGMELKKGLSTGYHTIGLGSKNPTRIHRLVAKSFVDGYEEGKDVNHIDGNKLNNHYTNLERVSRADNIRHAFRTGLQKGGLLNKYGILHPQHKVIEQLDMEGNLIKEFYGFYEAERETGVNKAHIHGVCNGKRNQSGGYKRRYKV